LELARRRKGAGGAGTGGEGALSNAMSDTQSSLLWLSRALSVSRCEAMYLRQPMYSFASITWSTRVWYSTLGSSVESLSRFEPKKEGTNKKKTLRTRVI